MMWFPFICLGAGVLLGLLKFSDRGFRIIDYCGNAALIVVMASIGANIGVDETVIASAGKIGFQCVVISLCAVACSVCFVVLLEKSVLPFDRLKHRLIELQVSVGSEVMSETDKKSSPLVWLIPVSILAGVGAGYYLIPPDALTVIDRMFTVSLAVLYITVGMGLSQNKGIFQYIKLLGWKITLLPVAILLGSITGGVVSALVLDISLHIPVLSAGGMSYYSITGAFMTQKYGVQIGAYGFLVNVLREFFTVLLLPMLIKISKGAPIASGASGNMDTMLVPVSKFVGVELGLVALITGTILTFAVPVLLPVLAQVLETLG